MGTVTVQQIHTYCDAQVQCAALSARVGHLQLPGEASALRKIPTAKPSTMIIR